MKTRNREWWPEAAALKKSGLSYKRIAYKLNRSISSVEYALCENVRARCAVNGRRRHEAAKAVREPPQPRKRTEPGWWKTARYLKNEQGFQRSEIASELGKSLTAVRYALSDARRQQQVRRRDRRREAAGMMAAE